MSKVFLSVYRIIALTVCLFGLDIQLGLFSGTWNPGTLIFFTIQSNIVCAVVWVLLLARPKLSLLWHGLAAQGILLTMVVYHFLLAGGSFSMSAFTGSLYGFGNLLVHYIVPTMMIVDFLFLSDAKPLSRLAPVIWALFPLAYLVFALIHGASGRPIYAGASTSYPYFFIDPGAPGLTGNPQGFGGVALYVLLISLAYVAAGYAMRSVCLLAHRRKAA